ncbi:hypothetical protein [Ligilactobacillus saerimneri]|uniref:Uncharacterized protein n=1 Tax=Ligilactobacillus saerimneri 30a TaxID=1227363 RepID=M5J861_9LACO|nr:hypothetical protein [Ligilactobacillus saerimneri]EKW99704.1 hypothetical protein D271_01178 [Ligilactobacillus saerimneri 30a]
MTYVAHLTRGRYGWFFWHYPEGMMTIAFLLTALAFACGMIAVFCLASAFIPKGREYCHFYKRQMDCLLKYFVFLILVK